MKFNFSNNNDFPPEFKIKGFEENIKVTDETKLLGIVITNDLKWERNTHFICTKAYRKIWILRRLKQLDIEPLYILEVYLKEIRSILELAVPAWHSGLTNNQLILNVSRGLLFALYQVMGKLVNVICLMIWR